jgi:Uma2 family endonuclease
MQPARYIPRYTYDDYLLWEGDWELIDGVPHAMSPSPTNKHQLLSLVIASEILNSLKTAKDKCGDCSIRQDLDWIVDEETILRPDIVVVCQEIDKYITSAPSIIIEILSPSSGHRDRIIKHEIYAEQGVKYYIIADPSTLTFQAYQLIDGKYQDYTATSFEIHTGCTIMIDVAKALAESG